MKKILLISLFVIGCSTPDPIQTPITPPIQNPTPTPVPDPVADCNCISYNQQRNIVYNGLAQITYDSGWNNSGAFVDYEDKCSNNGFIYSESEIYLSNFDVVYYRKLVVCTQN